MPEILTHNTPDNYKDAPQLLIVSTKFDPHVDIIANKLNSRKVPFVRFNTEDFPLKASATIVFEGVNHKEILHFPGKRNVDISDIKAVWYRRPAKFEFPSEFSPAIHVFAEEESTATIRGLWQILDCLWVNHPENNRKAELKINQLIVASKAGLIIPNTLITNDPKEARKFVKKYSDKRVIIKRLGSGLILGENEASGIYTSLVKEDDIKNINRVKYTPTLFQEYVPKDLELRVIIIGKQVFAIEIHSQQSDKGKIDWRKDTLNLPHRVHNLPTEIEQKLLTVVNNFGLNFGAIDIILTPDGKYVFLEINPNGQWGWLEDLTGLPLSDTMINLLTGKG